MTAAAAAGPGQHRASRGRPPKHNMSGPRLVVAEHAAEYRECIAKVVTASDVVVEVGCHEGVTTNLLARRCPQTIGIDKSDFQHERALRRFAHIRFEKLDATDIPAVRRAAGPLTTIIFLDISGSRECGILLSLVDSYERVFPALHTVVIKSFKLKRFLYMMQPAEAVQAPGDPHRRTTAL